MEETDQEWGEYSLDTSFEGQLVDYHSYFLDAVSMGDFGVFQPQDIILAGDGPYSAIDGYQLFGQDDAQHDVQCDPMYTNGYLQGLAEGPYDEANYNPVQPMGVEELTSAH